MLLVGLELKRSRTRAFVATNTPEIWICVACFLPKSVKKAMICMICISNTPTWYFHFMVRLLGYNVK